MASDLSPLQVWLLAARPKTLPAAAASTIVGSAVAYYDGAFHWGAALACLLGALLLQIGANLANDVFDYYRGADAQGRLGPLRVTQSGLLTPRQVLTGMWLTFGLAALLGMYLILRAGWPVLAIGLASIVAAVAYTGGPFPFGYYGLGDAVVFLFFGPVAVCGTYFVQADRVSTLALWASLPMGFLITAILVVNNLRDIASDRAAGKRTLAVRFGALGARWEYAICLAAAYLTALLIWAMGLTNGMILLSWLSLPLAFSLLRAIWRLEGRPLNQVLAGTGQLTLWYGVFFSIGVLLSG
ncbi:MAG: 1,4-dihydroxy-2-naphthoate polyprenyltransferase [Anaerolineales bacterium]|jgi:1,4-dihydroxy-2-naphthoate octaprenyltransferase|nr:1,4-dihydroxy-2-naphthoate polyprenyltransferase [Anaerolineales bacterium]